MKERDFRAKWEAEKAIYDAWGAYVLETVKAALVAGEYDLDCFLKIPAKYRLKNIDSLVDKAFYRPDKKYTDPYKEIEDKVGVRFVVLLLNDINIVQKIIEHNTSLWNFENCRHFAEDREKHPLLFTYQSVHYILRPAKDIAVGAITIPSSIPCEVQIRTLLQHAHAELTHDHIYKSKKTVKPVVQRTVAKSMALIETTDDFFSEAMKKLNDGPVQEYGIVERLDGLYFSGTDIKSHNQKFAVVLLDAFEDLIDDQLIEKIQLFLVEYDIIYGVIKEKYKEHIVYQQSVVFFLYWLIRNKQCRLLKDWPFSMEILDLLASDIGVSLRNW